MKNIRTGTLLLLAIMFCSWLNVKGQNTNTSISDNMIIRISEIGIDSAYLDEYISILKEESEASVRLEPGVIAIFPMYQKENPTQIRILEIYADKSAYANHIKSPHFQKYKTSTLRMVKSLKLIDMNSLDPEAMEEIFRKIHN